MVATGPSVIRQSDDKPCETTSCLDRVVHAFPVADALPTGCPCVVPFHVDLRDSVERRVRRKCLVNRVDLVQLGGQVLNPKDPYTAVRRRGGKTRHVRQNRLCQSNEVASKTGRILETHHSGVGRAGQEITISSGVCCTELARDQHRRGEMERGDDLAKSVCVQ